IRIGLANLALERIPGDRLALAQVRAARVTELDELRGVGKNQVLRVDGEREYDSHRVTAPSDQECFTSLGPLYDVGGVGHEVPNTYSCHSQIVVPYVTTLQRAVVPQHRR